MERAVVTKQADALLRVAKLIRRLRAVLLAQNWDWIAQVRVRALPRGGPWNKLCTSAGDC